MAKSGVAKKRVIEIKPQGAKHVAEVEWVSPRSGMPASHDKLLAVTEEAYKEIGSTFIGYANLGNFNIANGAHELYVFETKSDADAFKRTVSKFYRTNPQYFVIDADGNEVKERGKSVAAWKPELTVRPLNEEDDEEKGVERDTYESVG